MANRQPVPQSIIDQLDSQTQTWLFTNIVSPDTGAVDPADVTTLQNQMTQVQSDITDLEDLNTYEEAGSVTLSSGTATVTFAANKSNTSYKIALAGDANETFYWSNKAVGGFDITSSNGSSSANVDWSIRQ